MYTRPVPVLTWFILSNPASPPWPPGLLPRTAIVVTDVLAVPNVTCMWANSFVTVARTRFLTAARLLASFGKALIKTLSADPRQAINTL